MATAPTYCTHRQLKDVFPQVDSFDNKRAIYNWGSLRVTDIWDSAIDIDWAHDTGLVTELFFEGVKVDKRNYALINVESQAVDGAFDRDATTFDMEAGHSIVAGDIIKIDDEYMRVDSVATNRITITGGGSETYRGLFGTSSVAHVDSSKVKIILTNSLVGDAVSAGQDAMLFAYDSDLDLLLFVNNLGAGNAPSDYLIEAGDDFSTLKSSIGPFVTKDFPFLSALA